METLYCSRGRHDVDVSLFNKRSSSKTGFAPWCKPCMAEYDRERYQNGDKERKDANKEKHRTFVKEQLWAFLCSHQCVDCGNSDPEVLEFDHRDPAEKEFEIGYAIRHYSWARLLKEIAKCDVRCANCHRKRTIRQQGHWRGKMAII